MRLISIMLKYKPWRTPLLKLCRKFLPSRGSGSQGVIARARLLLKVLKNLCREMDGSTEVCAWGASLGRGVARATGPLAFLNSLGVLKPANGTRRPLQLGGGKELKSKRLCQGVRECQVAVRRLTTWVRLADALGAPPGPKTCLEWVTCHRNAVRQFRGLKLLRGKRSYVKHWLVRAWLLAGMHRAGIKCLSGVGDIHTKEFARAFPDSKRWVLRLLRPGFATTLADFLKYLEYSGRPEFLTMHLCVTLTGEMWKPISWYKANSQTLRRLMLEGSGCTGLHLLPALCVKDCTS